MLPRILVLAGLVLGASGPPGPDDVPEPPALHRVTIERGRATLVAGGRVEARTRALGAATVEGPGVLELGAGGAATLGRAGRWSVRLRGPAAVEWGDGPSGPLRLLHVREAEVEARRGGLAVELSGGAALVLGRAAVRVAARPAGLEVEHRGGEPARLRAAGREQTLAPPERRVLRRAARQ